MVVNEVKGQGHRKVILISNTLSYDTCIRMSNILEPNKVRSKLPLKKIDLQIKIQDHNKVIIVLFTLNQGNVDTCQTS